MTARPIMSLMPRPRRSNMTPRHAPRSAFLSAWWSANGGSSTSLPSGPPQGATPATQSSPAGNSNMSTKDTPTPTATIPPAAATTFTTSFPTTITELSTTFTSLAETIVSSSYSTPTSLPPSQTQAQGLLTTQAVCIGHGLDASAEGLLAVIILPSAIGFLLWVCRFFFHVRSLLMVKPAALRHFTTTLSTSIRTKRMVCPARVSLCPLPCCSTPHPQKAFVHHHCDQLYGLSFSPPSHSFHLYPVMYQMPVDPLLETRNFSLLMNN